MSIRVVLVVLSMINLQHSIFYTIIRPRMKVSVTPV